MGGSARFVAANEVLAFSRRLPYRYASSEAFEYGTKSEAASTGLFAFRDTVLN
jgi:hypothetical protein